MFAVDTRNIKSLRDWAACDNYFHTKKRPRNTVNWNADTERTLRESRDTHLKLVRNEDESYDLKLYSTVLVRYYRPQANGHHTVDLYLPSRWNTTSTIAFLDNAGWRHNKQLEPQRRARFVRLALYPSNEPDGWSAHLEFNKDRKLDCTKSWHLQSYDEMTGDEGAQFRYKAGLALQPIAWLLSLTQEGITPVSNAMFKTPFSKKTLKHSAIRQLQHNTLSQLEEIVEGHRTRLDEAELEGLVRWLRRTLDTHYSMRGTTLVLTEEAINGRLVRMLQDRTKHTFAKYKRVNKMWPVSNHPSYTAQYFSTREEARKAREKAVALGV